jgi:hypothetical protein
VLCLVRRGSHGLKFILKAFLAGLWFLEYSGVLPFRILFIVFWESLKIQFFFVGLRGFRLLIGLQESFSLSVDVVAVIEG